MDNKNKKVIHYKKILYNKWNQSLKTNSKKIIDIIKLNDNSILKHYMSNLDNIKIVKPTTKELCDYFFIKSKSEVKLNLITYFVGIISGEFPILFILKQYIKNINLFSFINALSNYYLKKIFLGLITEFKKPYILTCKHGYILLFNLSIISYYITNGILPFNLDDDYFIIPQYLNLFHYLKRQGKSLMNPVCYQELINYKNTLYGYVSNMKDVKERTDIELMIINYLFGKTITLDYTII